jgi:hypothetical protein
MKDIKRAVGAITFLMGVMFILKPGIPGLDHLPGGQVMYMKACGCVSETFEGYRGRVVGDSLAYISNAYSVYRKQHPDAETIKMTDIAGNPDSNFYGSYETYETVLSRDPSTSTAEWIMAPIKRNIGDRENSFTVAFDKDAVLDLSNPNQPVHLKFAVSLDLENWNMVGKDEASRFQLSFLLYPDGQLVPIKKDMTFEADQNLQSLVENPAWLIRDENYINMRKAVALDRHNSLIQHLKESPKAS